MSKKRPSAALNYPTMASVNGAAAVATGNGVGYFPLPLSSSSSWTKAANWFNMNNILYQSCTDPNGISGVCAPSFLCSGSNGRPSGSCSSSFASVCCISNSSSFLYLNSLQFNNPLDADVVNSCGGRVTINNTYWQSPSAINSGTTCALTISLNPSLVEQPNAIAQVRYILNPPCLVININLMYCCTVQIGFPKFCNFATEFGNGLRCRQFQRGRNSQHRPVHLRRQSGPTQYVIIHLLEAKEIVHWLNFFLFLFESVFDCPFACNRPAIVVYYRTFDFEPRVEY